MYGQTTVANVAADARMFRFEVEGMRQNGETNKRKFPVRRSGSTFITVSYDRMSDEYKRITRLGGRIVNIQPLDGSEAPAAAESEED
ncbi:phycobilisome linker polypeptide [Spirulina subsalsa]|uniref:phycobilisome linker polypeptide n=1 Tax=Spirulina subsalsa TaxID=54311 RepID=UPI0002E0E072|nr:phycobilisome linker polypeptide [Spirulina subsalsa]